MQSVGKTIWRRKKEVLACSHDMSVEMAVEADCESVEPTHGRKRILTSRQQKCSWQGSLLLCLLFGIQSNVDCLPTTGPRDFRQKFPVSREDIVVSMPVDQKHLTVARGSRAWRKVIFPSYCCSGACLLYICVVHNIKAANAWWDYEWLDCSKQVCVHSKWRLAKFVYRRHSLVQASQGMWISESRSSHLLKMLRR